MSGLDNEDGSEDINNQTGQSDDSDQNKAESLTFRSPLLSRHVESDNSSGDVEGTDRTREGGTGYTSHQGLKKFDSAMFVYP